MLLSHFGSGASATCPVHSCCHTLPAGPLCHSRVTQTRKGVAPTLWVDNSCFWSTAQLFRQRTLRSLSTVVPGCHTLGSKPTRGEPEMSAQARRCSSRLAAGSWPSGLVAGGVREGLRTTEGGRYQRCYPGTNQKPQVLANSEEDSILKLPWLRWSLSSAPCLKSHFVFETKVKMILHISKGSIWLQLSGQQRLRRM